MKTRSTIIKKVREQKQLIPTVLSDKLSGNTVFIKACFDRCTRDGVFCVDACPCNPGCPFGCVDCNSWVCTDESTILAVYNISGRVPLLFDLDGKTIQTEIHSNLILRDLDRHRFCFWGWDWLLRIMLISHQWQNDYYRRRWDRLWKSNFGSEILPPTPYRNLANGFSLWRV